MIQTDLDAITCIEGTATTEAPATTSGAPPASTTAAPPASTTGAPPASTTAAPPASTAAPPASTTAPSTFRADCIAQLTSDGHQDPTEACDAIILHNTYRANHNAAPFGIPSAALCQGAQDWADGEAEANENSIGMPSMEHSLPANDQVKEKTWPG